MTKIDDTVALLDNEGGVTRLCEEVEGWAKAQRIADMSALAKALEERCDPQDSHRRARFEAALDHLEDQLALVPTTEAVDALLALSLRERSRSVVVPRTRSQRVSAFASRLGYGQTKESFSAALERASQSPEHQELFACWLQEMVLRGATLTDDPGAERFRQVLVEVNHPLAHLPLELHSVEREAPSYMPLYGDKGLGRAIDTLASGAMAVRTIPPPADGASVQATLLDEPDTLARMMSAVRPWAEGKVGRVEAKIFALSPSVSSTRLGSWLLRALPLESTQDVKRLDCSRTEAHGIFGPLFSAASNGGAYSSGLGGAYGRLSAWTSLGALVSVSSKGPLDVDSIATAAEQCAFLSFRAPGPWFHDVAWDLGALALRGDGASVAVLAATDNE